MQAANIRQAFRDDRARSRIGGKRTRKSKNLHAARSRVGGDTALALLDINRAGAGVGHDLAFAVRDLHGPAAGVRNDAAAMAADDYRAAAIVQLDIAVAARGGQLPAATVEAELPGIALCRRIAKGVADVEVCTGGRTNQEIHAHGRRGILVACQLDALAEVLDVADRPPARGAPLRIDLRECRARQPHVEARSRADVRRAEINESRQPVRFRLRGGIDRHLGRDVNARVSAALDANVADQVSHRESGARFGLELPGSRHRRARCQCGEARCQQSERGGGAENRVHLQSPSIHLINLSRRGSAAPTWRRPATGPPQ